MIQAIFLKAMFSDFFHIGSGCLPQNVDQMHNVYLKGPFVIQIDEMFNIAGTSDKRLADGSGRMLKIIASDGCQNVTQLVVMNDIIYALLYAYIMSLRYDGDEIMSIIRCYVWSIIQYRP